MRCLRSGLAAIALTFVIGTSIQAEERSADITFSGGSVAAGVGYTWGDGVLHFNGAAVPFTVSGLSVVDVGIAHIEGVGDVYNLHRIDDFPGNYVAAGLGATVAGGGTVAALENQHGVRILFRSTTQGLKLNMSGDGIAVSLR